MPRIPVSIIAVLASVLIASITHAAPLIRSASLFETLTIEGVSLGMSPRDAFNILSASGYTANGIATFEDWTHGSIELVRGTYGGPDGHSSVSLGRADGRLALISQTLNKPGIDVGGEMTAVQSHFGIAADEPDCRMNSAGISGACQVRDAEEPAAATMKLTMSVQSMMILRSISRPQELSKTLE